MTPFLNIVAADLFKKNGGDFSATVMVFPNKRASLFFNKALTALTDKPLWSPQYTTISELFRQQSTLEVGDRIKLVCDLHLSYREVTGADEPLDQFYGWGELMLSDFDDIDKHLADARKVFALLGDIHEMDGVEFLTDNQQEVLQRFFSNFSKEHNTELKRRFLQLWNKFGDIYDNYRARLRQQGIAYEGMMYREVVEAARSSLLTPHSSPTPSGVYVFVGFNLLNEVEQALFSHCQKNAKAMFYWDYDTYYMSGHEAGKYIAQYQKYFPNELTADHPAYRNLGKQREVAFISSPTEDLQARYVAEWLTPERIAAGRRTAIVLADEGLLETVLHCLPPEVRHINITTGYPLENTQVASLVYVTTTTLLRKSFTLHNVNAILRHPYAKYISERVAELHRTLNEGYIYYPSTKDLAIDENLKTLFTPLKKSGNCAELNERLMWMVRTIAASLNASAHTYEAPATAPDHSSMDITIESLYRMHSILNRLSAQLSADWSVTLYQGLLQQVIRTTTIPFHGEPIEGIQIMGVLETRNLDFDHLLLLSCNEGNMPAKVNDSSFLPHAIRQGYGLTTVDNKVSIYAYYFHRLLQRTQDAHIIYNSSTSEGQTGEMSRFMLQLTAESTLPITRMALTASQDTTTYHPKVHENSQTIVDALLAYGGFSPSALGSYLRCPLQFFYKYVSGIRDEEETDEEEMDAKAFGNIFHKAAETIYASYKGRDVTKDYIDGLLNEKEHATLQRIVDDAFRTELFKQNSSLPSPQSGGAGGGHLSGLEVINREMIIKFLVNLLRFDRRHAPFTIIATEEGVYDTISVTVGGEAHDIRIGGKIDRLDSYVNEEGIRCVRVIDYKTGKYTPLTMPSVEEIFNTRNIKNHADYYLQALMYAGIVSKTHKFPIAPMLLYVQQAANEDYSPLLRLNRQPITEVRDCLEEYNGNVNRLIATILDKETHFRPTEDRKRCEACAFAKFCS